MYEVKSPMALRPIDDILFNLIYQDKAACQELLRVCYEDDTLEVISVTAQDSIANLRGRGVRLDVRCRAKDGSIRNVEVQRSHSDDDLRRIRYNASVITAGYTPKGTHFRDIPDVYVLYISEYDPFGKGKTYYDIVSAALQTKEVVNDGLHRRMINAKVDDGSRIARLMRRFMQPDFADDEFPEISKQVSYFKHTEKGVSTMCDATKKMFDDMFRDKEARYEAMIAKMTAEHDAELAKSNKKLAESAAILTAQAEEIERLKAKLAEKEK